MCFRAIPFAAMAGLVVIASFLAAGAFARRVRDAQLESQTVANGPGLVPVPAQSFITHPLTMMGAATQPTYHGDGGPLRHTWSPSMSMADDEYRPDLKKASGEDGVGALEAPVSRRDLLLLTGAALGATFVDLKLHLEYSLGDQPVESEDKLGRRLRVNHPVHPAKNEMLPDSRLLKIRRVFNVYISYDKDEHSFIEGKDLKNALLTFGLGSKADKLEELEFVDVNGKAGKLADFKDPTFSPNAFYQIITSLIGFCQTKKFPGLLSCPPEVM